MELQYHLDTTSLPVLALIAAKAINIMYPYMKTAVKEDIVQFDNRNEALPAYSVYSTHNNECLINIYRDEDMDDPNNSHHYYMPAECDTFIEEDVNEGVYTAYSRESEFDELFLALVEIHSVTKGRYPEELIIDLVKTIVYSTPMIEINVIGTGDVQTLQLIDNNHVIWFADFYKSEDLLHILKGLVTVHKEFTISV